MVHHSRAITGKRRSNSIHSRFRTEQHLQSGVGETNTQPNGQLVKQPHNNLFKYFTYLNSI